MHDKENTSVDALEPLSVSLNNDHERLQEDSPKTIGTLKYDIVVQNKTLKEQ